MSAFLRSVLHERDALTALANVIDEQAWTHAVRLISSANLTVTSACGASGFAARKFAHSLCCIECPAKFVSPSDAIHGGIGVLRAGDVLVLVSKGGQTDELHPLARLCRQKGAHIIAVTQFPDSAIGRGADVVIRLPDVLEDDPYDMMPTASFTATTAIFHALMMEIMERRHYGKAEYARNHIGGAVGKRIGSGEAREKNREVH